MTSEPVRASSGWLTLREAADADARARELVETLRPHLPATGTLAVHDLGCGTGSMARWLAPLLRGPQHWVLYDRDAELLALVEDAAPTRASDGAAVSVETRCRDITRLDPDELAGASLVTASALLDMMTGDELDRYVDACAGAGCAVLITLSVVGRVELTPTAPLDQRVEAAFNDHQRRTRSEGRLLGPDALVAAVERFTWQGRAVVVRPSAWRLGPDQRRLAAEWFEGWWTAACEQSPDLLPHTVGYADVRRDQAAAGGLSVVVHHEDLLVLP